MRLWACSRCSTGLRLDAFCHEHGSVNGWAGVLDGETFKVRCPHCFKEVQTEPNPQIQTIELDGECPCGGSRAWIDQAELPKPDLSVKPIKDGEHSWISGSFEGELRASVTGPATASPGIKGAPQQGYQWRILQGRLLELQTVEGPPESPEPDEVQAPLRQDSVKPVLIGRTAEGKLVSVELSDFRLHHWEVVDPSKTAGVRGVAYGRVISKKPSDPQPDQDSNDPLPDQLAPEAPEPLPASSECGVCAKTVQIALATLSGWLCGMTAGLVTLSATLTMCFVSHLLAQHSLGSSSFAALWRDRLLLILSATGLGLYFYLGWCDQAPLWPLGLPLLALLGGSWSRSCAVKTLLVLMLHVASWSSCSAGLCAADTGSGLWGRLGEVVQSAVREVLNEAPLDQARQESVLSGSRAPISIDQALRQPALLDDCRTPIRFESGLLFDFDSSDLRSRHEPDLKKLLQLTQLARFQDRSFIITGHADQAGDNNSEGRLRNKRLSLDRARSVEAWLRQRAQYRDTQLQAVGAGSWLPINVGSQFRHLNRRVEVQLSCAGTPVR